METPLPTPCRNLCVLDAGGESCTGCGRTMDEIARWSGMTDAERTAVMARVRDFPSPSAPPAHQAPPSA